MTNDDERNSWDESNEFLVGGGQAAKFPKVGTVVKGTVLASEVRDQTEIGTGAIKTYPDGNHMRQTVITLQTGLQDDEDDDGIRRVYVKGNMRAAVAKAMGKNRLAYGGILAIKYVADGKPTNPGFNPPKQYAAKYEPPTDEIGEIDDFEVSHVPAARAQKPGRTRAGLAQRLAAPDGDPGPAAPDGDTFE